MRTIVTIFLLVFVLNTTLGAIEPYPSVIIKPFPIIPWLPPKITEQQMNLFRDANFTVMWIFPPAEKSYQEMKKYWNGNFMLAPGSVAETAEERLKNVQAMVDFHPEDNKLIGYFIKDEPSFDMFSEIKGLMDYCRMRKPDRICFVNLFPSYAGAIRTKAPTYIDYVEAYFKELRPRYSSVDHYPCLRFNMDHPAYYHDLEILRRQALKNNSRQIGFVQIYSTSMYRNVSESDIAWQVNSLLAYGCKGLWYYTYAHHVAYDGSKVTRGKAVNYSVYPARTEEYSVPVYSVGDGILDQNDRPSGAYKFVKKVNAETLAWGPLLSGLTSTGVRHCGRTTLNNMPTVPPVGTQPLNSDSMFSSSMEDPLEYITGIRTVDPSADMGFIVGFFEDSNNVPYVMIVNKRHGENMNRQDGVVDAIIKFRSDVKAAYSVSNIDGKCYPIEIKGCDSKVTINGGGAVLMKLEINNERR